MRTTLTIDDDLAAQIERLRRERETSLSEVVNEALRRGLRELMEPKRSRKKFKTPVIDGITPKIASFDNIAEILAIAEGEAFK